MVRCTFCDTTLPPGTGRMHILNEGKILHFCTSKCRKNLLKLKRKPLTTKWTNHYKKPTA